MLPMLPMLPMAISAEGDSRLTASYRADAPAQLPCKADLTKTSPPQTYVSLCGPTFEVKSTGGNRIYICIAVAGVACVYCFVCERLHTESECARLILHVGCCMLALGSYVPIVCRSFALCPAHRCVCVRSSVTRYQCAVTSAQWRWPVPR
jgi:hypothetical protein